MFSVDGSCDTNEDCRTGRCLPILPDTSYCARPCCGSSECNTVLLEGQLVALACAPIDDLNGLACARVLGDDGGAPVGAPCTGDGDCRSGLCADEGYCSDHCCDDASCGDPARFACRPGASATGWALRCVRK
jgi:hypothetical protein